MGRLASRLKRLEGHSELQGSSGIPQWAMSYAEQKVQELFLWESSPAGEKSTRFWREMGITPPLRVASLTEEQRKELVRMRAEMYASRYSTLAACMEDEERWRNWAKRGRVELDRAMERYRSSGESQK